MGGLSGKRTKDGVKKTLIQRNDQPAYCMINLAFPTSIFKDNERQTHWYVNDGHELPGAMASQCRL